MVRSSTAAIAGVGQVVQRPGEHALIDALGPIELMAEAARIAAADAGAPALLNKVDWVGVAGGWWRYTDPGRLVADLVDARRAGTALTSISGTAPQDLLGLAAERIAKGEIEVALVLGGEARWTAQRLKREGLEPGWAVGPGGGKPETIGAFPDELVDEFRVLGSAATAYALFEDSLRLARNEGVDAHRERIAELWSSFSRVAEQNPYAWSRTVVSPAEVRDATPGNRMISFPYTKAMVANNTVDMASAILVCSLAAARSAGISQDHLVFPQVVASSHETWKVVNRGALRGAPALTAAAQAALSHAGLGIDDIEHVDLYACFPAIVQMSAAALGLDAARHLTVTGGLGFAGAAVGNATGHSIAAMVGRIREGGVGLVHGNGGNATKHSFAIYSTDPPRVFARIDCQDRVDHGAVAELPSDYAGAGVVEAATVVYGRESPSHVLAAFRAEPGRVWASSTDPDLMAMVETVGVAGQRAERTGDGVLLI